MKTQRGEEALKASKEYAKKARALEKQIKNGVESGEVDIFINKMPELFSCWNRWKGSYLVAFIEYLCPKLCWIIEKCESSAREDDQGIAILAKAHAKNTLEDMASWALDATGRRDIGEKIKAISETIDTGKSFRGVLDLLLEVSAELREAQGSEPRT